MSRFLLLFLMCLPPLSAVTLEERAKIDEATGAKGVYTQVENVYRVSFPRGDVKVAVQGRTMHPFLGFTSWAAFTPTGKGLLMVMGDLVLLEDEVNPVMSVALESGLEVTALHNHFLHESPRVLYMHIGGVGAAERLAGAVRKTLDKAKEVRAGGAQRAIGPSVAEENAIDPAAIDAILGVKGQANAGMYKMQIGREATMHGRKIGNQMGVNTWAAMAGTMEMALVDGDFAMLESEVQPVLKALRAARIDVVTLHNHMTQEEPRYVFLHYWGQGRAVDLARGVKSALDAQKPLARTALFVCEHGAGRSVIAVAYFNKLAQERGLPYRAVSRGTAPDASFGAAVVNGLRSDGFGDLAGKPQGLGMDDLNGAAIVVSFAVEIPGTKAGVKRLAWNDVPGPGQDYTKAREEIQAKVEELIEELAKSGRH